MISLFFLFALLPFLQIEDSSNLELSISTFDKIEGHLAIAIYREQDVFLSNEPFKGIRVPVISDTITTSILLPNDTYAVSIYHDKNNNKDLDTSLFGIPTEGYGFSNNVMGFMGPPSFSKASFVLKKDSRITIKLK